MPRPVKDMTGARCGRLIVVQRADRGAEVKDFRARWVCKCDCGNTTVVIGRALRAGTQSCGCLGEERRKEANTEHGHSKHGAHSRTYNSWQAMRRRCLTKTHASYGRYGARGITICERWNSFECFLADMGERPDGTSLDRIDVNNGYEPSNCRWATPSQQSANTRRALIFEFQGETMPLTEWALKLGIPYSRLKNRIRDRGWTVERALSTPISSDDKNAEIQ
jgi:hypothetical protein